MKKALYIIAAVVLFAASACSHESAQVESTPGNEAVIVEEVPVTPQTTADTITTDTVLNNK